MAKAKLPGVNRLWPHLALSAALASISIQISAEPSVRFAHLQRDQGLSNHSIYSIAQDRYGFMWLGTADGLNRYDGRRFKTFRHDSEDPTSLSHNFVTDLQEDSSGYLWVATLGGVNRYDPATETFRRYGQKSTGGPSDSRTCDLHEDAEGLWLATQGGINRYDRDQDRFVPLDLSPALSGDSLPHTHSITRDSRGDLWVGTLKLGLFRVDGESGEIERFQHDPNDSTSLGSNEVWVLLEDSDGRLWVGTHGGLDRYDPVARRFQHFQHDPADPTTLSSPYVEALTLDSQGDLWIGTDGGGANLFDRQSESFVRFRHSPDEEMTLADDVVRKIFEDQQNNLWFGTYNGGVSYYNRETSVFSWTTQGEGPQGLTHSAVLSFFEDPDGTLWVGTENGLNRLDADDRTVRRYLADPSDPGALQGKAVLSIHRDSEGTLWVGTYFGGLHRMDPDAGTFESLLAGSEPERLMHPHIWDIHEDRSGRFWVASFSGVCRRIGSSDRFKCYTPDAKDPNSLASPNVWQVFEDSTDRIWFLTHGGVSLYLPEEDQLKTFRHDPDDAGSLSSDLSFFMAEDLSGKLWIATEGGGLNLFDPSTETFRRFGTRDGLASDTVYCLQVDAAGRLWASTSSGLSVFDGVGFSSFIAEDGLTAEPFTKLSCFQGSDGRLYFGGARGFNSFLPQEIDLSPKPVRTVMTDFRIFNQSVRAGAPGSPLTQAVMDTDELVLDHDQSMVGFEMTVFDYRAPERNRYRYKLEGFNEQWVEAGADRVATYTNLDPGRYLLRLQGADSHGVWSEPETTLRLRVLPPYWETWWFRSGILTVILGTAVAFHLLRLRVVRRHNQALQVEIEQRQQAESERQKLLENMESLVEEKMAQVQILQGMLPICAGCKKIRDDEGYWADVEIYLRDHSAATFSHGICPSCAEQFAPELGMDEEVFRKKMLENVEKPGASD